MRVFVLFAVCLTVVSAAPQIGFSSSSAGASAQAGANGYVGVLPGAGSTVNAAVGANTGQVPVTVEYVPPTYSIQTGGVRGSGTNSALANAEAEEYTRGYQTGLRQAIIDSQIKTTNTANANAGVEIKYAEPIVEKNFFFHIAQEDASANASANTLTITPRKHYKVIFIKAPAASANAAARARAASRTEEKTIVYVLVNKPVDADADANASAGTFNYGKPEVYFIKYQGPKAKSIATAEATAGAGASAGGPFGASFPGAGAGAAANARAITSGGFSGGFNNAGASANAGANAIGGIPYQF